MKIICLALAFWFFFFSFSVASPNKIQILAFDQKALPKEISYKGEIVAGGRWLDKNGENLLLLCETGSFNSPVPPNSRDNPYGEWGRAAELHSYHYVKDKEKHRLLWKLYDFVEICPYDLDLAFLPNSLTITDLDHNGIAESTFLYKLGCRSDLSPVQLKLIMHEGKAKYAIRGETIVPGDPPQKKIGGQQIIDPVFHRAPKVFLDHAVQQWNAFVEERFGE
ncbi:MAG: hypothetical protein A3K23_02125 [Desulfobacca sp. RBG_16_58_9]|nr:MAG: hypothetical protein A3K23_02125 [Desulfobacca sp. RBG_16_58_9]